jgi:sigma-B regulation protein RsbU (phosphoserine phosphatase)
MFKKIIDKNPAILNASILIVDDNDTSRFVAEKFFLDAGFKKINFAHDGAEALSYIEKKLPDIVIADLYMPKMNGFEFISKVRSMEDYDHLPIIVQTASKTQEDIRKAYSEGANDVISKPISKEEVLARTAFHLENSMFRKRIDKELNAARELQKSILPTEEDVIIIKEKYSIDEASLFVTSSEIGGDFWGFKKISHAELSVFTVDITGHGVAAALNTFRVHSILNDANNFFSSTNLFLKKLNKRIKQLMPVGQYCTMFYGVINFQDNFVQYANAASPGAIIIRSNGEHEILKSSGLPLGVSEDAEYESFEAKFSQNDIMILFSDALIESENAIGDFLEIEEVINLCIENRSKSATEIIKLIEKLFKDHVGNIAVNDDLTLNVYKRN